jgi:predicted naringenin-chalcone synthase
MSYILDIATAVPRYAVSNAELLEFYSKSIESSGEVSISRKLNIISGKTKIKKRYSCIPDFNGNEQELFTNGNYNQSVERRTEVYKENLLPLATDAIDKLLLQTKCNTNEITHLITVTCTGVFAPGFEFLVAEHYNLGNTEKLALNFLGCYAALKAIKHANYIAKANPSACILIVCTELCSLHFNPSTADEDILSNLLFADGAAAVLIVGNENKLATKKTVISIDAISSVYIPNTQDLMSWNISSTAFNMYLSKHIVDAIRNNIYNPVTNFLKKASSDPTYWAIHPGGIRIVEAVKESLKLSDKDVNFSLDVLENYGNMSSPTILFILKNIFDYAVNDTKSGGKNIFACAFGPGLNIEMINLSVINTALKNEINNSNSNYEIQV